MGAMHSMPSSRLCLPCQRSLLTVVCATLMKWTWHLCIFAASLWLEVDCRDFLLASSGVAVRIHLMSSPQIYSWGCLSLGVPSPSVGCSPACLPRLHCTFGRTYVIR